MAGISTTLLEVVAEYTCHRVDYDYKNNRPVAVRFVGMDATRLIISAGLAWAYTCVHDH